jgi:hypothetical protein
MTNPGDGDPGYRREVDQPMYCPRGGIGRGSAIGYENELN